MSEPAKDIPDPQERRRQNELELLLRELRSIEKLEKLVREHLAKKAEKKND